MSLFFLLFQVDIGQRFLLRPGVPITRFSNLGALLSTILAFILGVGAFLMLLFLVIGGLRYIFSGGDEKAIASARGQITVAIVGFLIIFFSFAIIKIVERLTGLKITTSP